MLLEKVTDQQTTVKDRSITDCGLIRKKDQGILKLASTDLFRVRSSL
jgi:hypothetical protein